jgi:lipopolysaccharide export system permease protein
VGVSTSRMVLPALVLSVLMSLLTFLFNDLIVPKANLAATNTLEVALGKALTTETGNNVLYSRFGRIKQLEGESIKQLTHLFYSRKYLQGQMLDVTVIDFSRGGQRQMLTAESGRWNESQGMWNSVMAIS